MTNPKAAKTTDRREADAVPPTAIPTLDSLFEAQERVLARMSAIAAAMLEFNRMGIKHAASMSEAIGSAASLGEAMELNARFTRAVLEESITTAGRIAALSMGGLLGGAAAPAPEAGGDTPHPQAQAAE